jgi:hypothetical protein
LTIQEETTPDVRLSDGDGDGENLVHTYCCIDEMLGLCGRDLTDLEETAEDSDEPECIVCEDIAGTPEVCKVCPTTLRVLGLWNGS